jgi:transcription elongation factor Elf1
MVFRRAWTIPLIPLKIFKMEEVEKFFKCPYCLEKISMIVDVSVEGTQTYIEDCEVCCQPIQISYLAENAKVKNFHSEKAQP